MLGLKGLDLSRQGGVFSPTRVHRYLWWTPLQLDLLRPRRGTCLFCMLNPSKADERRRDPTVERCRGFAMSLGCSLLMVANLYAWRATDKDQLCVVDDPVGPDNDEAIRVAAAAADLVVVGWGDGPAKLDITPRARQVVELIGRPALCLGTTEAGMPRHPLYIPGAFEPVPYVLPPLAT